jgi:hypothetical protein
MLSCILFRICARALSSKTMLNAIMKLNAKINGRIFFSFVIIRVNYQVNNRVSTTIYPYVTVTYPSESVVSRSSTESLLKSPEILKSAAGIVNSESVNNRIELSIVSLSAE